MERREIKRRKRTYKSSNPTRIIQQGWCHQCKMKQDEVIACDNFWRSKKDNKCGGKYCIKCIERHYQQDANQLKQLTSWYCFSCCQICTCAICKRKRGEFVSPRKPYEYKHNRNDTHQAELFPLVHYQQQEERIPLIQLLQNLQYQQDFYHQKLRDEDIPNFDEIPVYQDHVHDESKFSLSFLVNQNESDQHFNPTRNDSFHGKNCSYHTSISFNN